MTFIHHDSTPALHRQLNDTRPYWLRVRHWLVQIQRSQRKLADTGSTITDKDNIDAYYKRLQQKTSLFS